MGHGTRNDDERDYERDYDQRQMGSQNEVAPADVRVRTRQSAGVGPDKTTEPGMGGGSDDGPSESLSRS